MAIDRIPGVGPQNTDIATAVAAVVPTNTSIAAAVGTSFNPTNMTLRQTITSSSNNISTGTNWVYALVIGGGGSGSAGGANSGASGAAGGAAFGLVPFSAVAVIGAGGPTSNIVNRTNANHNGTMGSSSRYGIIQANGGGTPGYSWLVDPTGGWSTNNTGMIGEPSNPGTSGIDYGRLAVGPIANFLDMTANKLQIQSIFTQPYQVPFMGAEFPTGASSTNTTFRPTRATVAAAGGGGASNNNFVSFAGGNTPNYSGGAGVVGNTQGPGGGGGGAGWLAVGSAGTPPSGTTIGGGGGAGGAGGGGGGGGTYNNSGNGNGVGGAGGNGAIILYY